MKGTLFTKLCFYKTMVHPVKTNHCQKLEVLLSTMNVFLQHRETYNINNYHVILSLM